MLPKPFAITLLLLVSGALAGCSSRPSASDLNPLELTYIRIGQDQYSTGGVNPHYEGSVAFPYCLHNPNDADVMARYGYEVYQVLGLPHAPGLRLVKEGDSGLTQFRANGSTLAINLVSVILIHNVLLNETVEGNSTDYTIHIWHQILNPEPIHRVDRWFNMTFTPYGPSDTTYSEGEPC